MLRFMLREFCIIIIKGAALGMSKDFGRFGAMSFTANTAVSVFQKQTPTAPEVRQSGISYSLQYANSLTDNTNLQLLAYRYTGKDYVDFNEFNSNALYHRGNRKERYGNDIVPKVLMVALLAYLLGCKHIEIVLVMKLAQILLTIQQLNLSISHYQRIIKN